MTGRTLAIGLLLAASVAGGSLALAAVKAPAVRVRTLETLPTPLPLPYSETATPAQVNAQIDAAFVRAKATNKRVVIDLGGNWCSWCRMLAGVMELPDAKPFMDAHFEVVPVHVSSVKGKTDRNGQVLKRFGIKEPDGYPFLVIAEPNGKVLVRSSDVTDDNHHTPQTMLDWIAQYAVQAPAAVSRGVS